MHKKIPKSFIFIEYYNSQIFRSNNKKLGIIYRNYNSKNKENELKKIAKACKKNGNQFFVSNDLKLAIKFNANGLYVPSFNRTRKYYNLEKKNIKVIGSAHNQREIKEKISQNCSAIFLSPIFYVDKNKKFLGLYKFNFISLGNKTPLYALGGISEKNIGKLKLLNAKGFGAITLFKKKPAFFRPVLIKNNFF